MVVERNRLIRRDEPIHTREDEEGVTLPLGLFLHVTYMRT